MASDDVLAGMRIIESMLRDQAKTLGVGIEGLEWGRGRDDFENRLHTLAYTVNEKRFIEKFTMEDLSDAPGDNIVRQCLQERVVLLVE